MDARDELLRRTEPSALLAMDGTVRSLNGAMATALGRPAEQCVGRGAEELLPGIESLVAHTAGTKKLTVRVLKFSRPGGTPVACLTEARPLFPAEGEPLVWVHLLDASNDLGSLLIPFRLAAEAAGLALCGYSSEEGQFEWLGGAPALAALIPETRVSLLWAVRRVHADDRAAMGRLIRSASAESPWITFRFLAEHGDWHHLTCQARRMQLGHDGPEQIFAVIRDDTRIEARKQEMLAALGAERHRADEIAVFSSALISAATEQELQQVVLTRLAATLGGTGALLAFVDDAHLHVSSDGGIPPELAHAVQHLSPDAPSPLPYAIRSGRPQFIPNREEYGLRWPQGVSLPWIGPDVALSITPLSPASDEPLGAWMVTYDSEHRLSSDERALMRTLAELAGQALKRIRWQQACVKLAEAVQHSMLPTLPRHLSGLEVTVRYRSGQVGLDIGGDWYDAFETPDGTVALVIGDAQGHDVDAAAFMGQVRASMRAIASHEPDPGTALTRTNELLVTMSAPRFASCTMLQVDPRDGTVTGASAGHVPLLCAHDDGSHDVRELPGGPVLGVLPNAAYPQETFVLDKGAALVMVTDGLVEGPNLTLEAGLERAGRLAALALRSGLGTETIADRVMDAAGGVDHLDDVAALVIRRV